MANDLSMRSAREDDAGFVAWVILVASRGHLSRGWFDLALDRSEQECLAFIRELCTAGANSWWHYSNFLVSEIDGWPVAALSAFRAGDVYPASPAAFNQAMETHRIPAREQAQIWDRGSYLYVCSPRPDDSAWIIEHVAVMPRCRGRGYTSALVERALEKGRLCKLKTAQITFVIGNVAAERAYRRAGFRVAAEVRDDVFAARVGAPGLCRLATAL